MSDLRHQLIRFLCVGTVGFIVDGGTLFSLLWLGFDPYLARIISFPLAVLATWLLNRNWTFASANRDRPAQQLNRYIAVQVTGAMANYAVYANIIAAYDETYLAAGVGFVLGSAVGTLINFFGARMLVFKS